MIESINTLPRLRPRHPESHKGIYGRVLIIGGSEGMAGAPALAARAALRCGAGLVRMAVPHTIWPVCCSIEPCATCLPLPVSDTGRINASAGSYLIDTLAAHDAAAIGPGMSTGSDLKILLETLLANYSGPLVIDADGLNNLAALGGFPLNARTILTPHPGEMARLWQGNFRTPLPRERETQAIELATKTGAVVVLKGANTVVTDGKTIYSNGTGNPGMATGGSGDVLTGCMTALLADRENNLPPLQAAILAVHIHGLAGDLAAEHLTQIAMTASDLIDFLPAAWGMYLAQND